MITIGQSKVSDMVPYLNDIAYQYNLRLNRPKEFKMARLLLANLYMN